LVALISSLVLAAVVMMVRPSGSNFLQKTWELKQLGYVSDIFPEAFGRQFWRRICLNETTMKHY
jgi:hypothetical protein